MKLTETIQRRIQPQLFSDLQTVEGPLFPLSPENGLRSLWTRKGIYTERQEEVIQTIAAKAQPDAMVGPFRIPIRQKAFWNDI